MKQCPSYPVVCLSPSPPHRPQSAMQHFYINLFNYFCVATLLFAGSIVAAFPVRPIRVVIGFPAGGPLDQHARLLTDKMQAVLDQPIAIDHKQGKVWTLAAISSQCHPALPDVPTVIRSGIKGFEGVGFTAFGTRRLAPRHHDQAQRGIKQIMNNADVKTRMVKQGAAPAFLGSHGFEWFLVSAAPR